jgi:cytochrome bd-type quinol oxidase subunit 2
VSALVHQIGLLPVLGLFVVAIIVGLFIRWRMKSTGKELRLSHRGNAVIYWICVVLTVVIAALFVLGVRNAAGIVLAVLFLVLAGAFGWLARRESKRAGAGGPP